MQWNKNLTFTRGNECIETKLSIWSRVFEDVVVYSSSKTNLEGIVYTDWKATWKYSTEAPAHPDWTRDDYWSNSSRTVIEKSLGKTRWGLTYCGRVISLLKLCYLANNCHTHGFTGIFPTRTEQFFLPNAKTSSRLTKGARTTDGLLVHFGAMTILKFSICSHIFFLFTFDWLLSFDAKGFCCTSQKTFQITGVPVTFRTKERNFDKFQNNLVQQRLIYHSSVGR